MSEEKYCQTIEELREWGKTRAIALGCNPENRQVKAILEAYEVCFIHGQKSREADVARKDAALKAADKALGPFADAFDRMAYDADKESLLRGIKPSLLGDYYLWIAEAYRVSGQIRAALTEGEPR